MRVLRERSAFAILMASLWIGWAAWANAPLRYSALAMETEINAVLGEAKKNMQPAEAGFPFAYMRYDYSQADQLTIYDTALSAILPNVLFTIAGALGVSLLVMRVRRVSIVGGVTFCCLMAPAVFMYLRLNGLHSDIMSYLYLVPLILLVASFATDSIRERRRQKNEMLPSNGFSAVAP
jgi:hypothetical protein